MNSMRIKPTNNIDSAQVIFERLVAKEQAGIEKKRPAKAIMTAKSKTTQNLDFDFVKGTNRFFINRMGFSIEMIFDFIPSLLSFKNIQSQKEQY